MEIRETNMEYIEKERVRGEGGKRKGNGVKGKGERIKKEKEGREGNEK